MSVYLIDSRKTYDKVSVIIPAYNEEQNIRNVINIAKNCNMVNQIIVVNNNSSDRTFQIALEENVEVINCPMQGKGYAMETGIEYAKNEILVFLDADIDNYSENVVDIMINPLIYGNADFVKARFSREGGRVTELVVKPMLELLYPDMYKFSQPLSGMIAGKKSFFEEIELEKDYGVDIGILLDMIDNNATVCEVNIGEINNNSQDWKSLSKMSKEVMNTILKRKNINQDFAKYHNKIFEIQ